ncbi:MAG: AAA family ATPase [Arcobacter sp.]|nr:MAG: AAA family ATPase [Arcobacter sp.]
MDNTHLQNLFPVVKEKLSLSNEERKQFIFEDKWITYPLAKEILSHLDFLLNHPKKSRMPCMLLVGETNNGKTSIINKFIKTHPPYEAEEVTITPVLSVVAPETATITDLFSKILLRLGAPYRNGDKINKKRELIEHYFNICEIKMLIVDEIHNILVGPVSKQKAFMNALKNLSTELQIPIVIVGIADALHATNTDSKINNRFKPIALKKWLFDRDFLSLLASIEKTLPLKKASNLASTKELAYYIHDYSEGYIGEIVDLINTSVKYSIDNNIEKIDLQCLKKCKFVKPSNRKHFDDIKTL